MEDAIKKGNQSILDHVIGEANKKDPNQSSIDLCTCRYEYNDDFASMDDTEYADARKAYESFIAARFNLLTYESKEDRLKVAEVILHDVTMLMKQMGYDIDYNNIRADMDKETCALIAITDIITVYSFVLNRHENEMMYRYIGDDIENSNMEFVSQMESDNSKYEGAYVADAYDDHNVSGLIDN